MTNHPLKNRLTDNKLAQLGWAQEQQLCSSPNFQTTVPKQRKRHCVFSIQVSWHNQGLGSDPGLVLFPIWNDTLRSEGKIKSHSVIRQSSSLSLSQDQTRYSKQLRTAQWQHWKSLACFQWVKASASCTGLKHSGLKNWIKIWHHFPFRSVKHQELALLYHGAKPASSFFYTCPCVGVALQASSTLYPMPPIRSHAAVFGQLHSPPSSSDHGNFLNFLLNQYCKMGKYQHMYSKKDHSRA